MKKTIKQISRRVAPGLANKYRVINRLDTRTQEIYGSVNHIKERVEALYRGDNRINELKSLLSQVEPYQPTYGLTGFISDPARDSRDRCEAIEQYLRGQLRGLRMLDIGSSLGYVCFYFSDRGAKAEGWEMNQGNAEASRAISRLNGISIDIKTKWFDPETVKDIDYDQYDVVTILSVVHHIIHHNGLDYTQKLMAEIVRKTPTLVVELARKGEDMNLFWDEAQPDDELAIFDLVKDEISIKKIGEFGNHLSSNDRPLYVIERKKQVKVNNHTYSYDKKSIQAYEYSEAALHKEKRRYYWSKKYVIKEYSFEEGVTGDNAKLIVNEIATLQKVNDIPSLPKLIDFEITAKGAKIVYSKIKGDLIDLSDDMSDNKLQIIYEDVLTALKSLHGRGIFHNDVRSWNIMFDGKNAVLIDLAQASGVDEDHDLIALMWVMAAIRTGVREPTKVAKVDLPEKKNIPAFLHADYEKIKAGINKAEQL